MTDDREDIPAIDRRLRRVVHDAYLAHAADTDKDVQTPECGEIGRASCRERV